MMLALSMLSLGCLLARRKSSSSLLPFQNSIPSSSQTSYVLQLVSCGPQWRMRFSKTLLEFLSSVSFKDISWVLKTLRILNDRVRKDP